MHTDPTRFSLSGGRIGLLLLIFLLLPHAGGCSCGRGETCISDCEGKECGDDGCGDLCGECDDGFFCNDAQICEAVCVPDCDGKECGDDGCGGLCGQCDDGFFCNDAQLCEAVCVPDCEGKECGDDGCGDLCGQCDDGFFCNDAQLCEAACMPDCDGRCCGHDGCGGICPNVCDEGLACDLGTCTCSVPFCAEHPPLPSCAETTAAPTSPEEVAQWIRENSHPLECIEDGELLHNIDILMRDLGESTVVIFGEVHGSAELGHLSAVIFEQLARAGVIDAMTMEIGMDLTEPIRTYISTGAGPLITQYEYSRFSPDMFLVTLVEAARGLYLEGIELNVYGSDIPMRLEWVNEELHSLAATLSQAAGDLILDGLPQVPTGHWILPLSYFNQVDDYFNQMQARYGTICAELSEDDCRRLEMLVAGLWCGAFSLSEKSYYASQQEWDLFFTRREPVIVFNFVSNISTSEDRTYSHYGAAHSALDPTIVFGDPSVAYELNTNHAPTLGSVYSTTPAYGSGSRIRYGQQIHTLDPEPAVVASAMSSAEHSAYWLSTRHPALDCTSHPLLDYSNPGGHICAIPCSEAYHAFTYIPLLTPERTTRSAAPSGMAARILRFRELVAAAEREHLLDGP